ncbi:phosphotransferase [Wenzhouxiangella sediminis]|uniref:phosphotransferase n=1 Tax=Wenzhouxiangella sediminis TaxID=1792836 RepID=UPI0015F28178|nr:phosphotransferase [Wenzhouxiangella sediminis]
MTEALTLIDTWRDWGLPLVSRPRLIERIEVGKTNRNYRLQAPGLDEDLLLRINHPDPARLGIDRERERRIIDLTAQARLSRPYRHWDPAQRFVVFPYLEGRTWTHADFEDSKQTARLRQTLNRLHEIESPGTRRSYHAYLLDYWQRLEQAGRTDPALERAWRDFEPRLRAFDRGNWPARLVHHDLIPDNILETTDGLCLIDWEYAAPGHPDIDVWTVDPAAVSEPFVAEMMDWINGLWERLIGLPEPNKP